MDICLKQISDKNDNNERKQNTEMFTKLSSTEYIQTRIWSTSFTKHSLQKHSTKLTFILYSNLTVKFKSILKTQSKNRNSNKNLITSTQDITLPNVEKISMKAQNLKQ